MFNTYTSIWITERIFDPDFVFNSSTAHLPDMFAYAIPPPAEMPQYMEYITSMPDKDSPEVFGLNATADTAYRLAESLTMLNTLIDTMPKEAGGSDGKTPEDIVREKLENDILKNLPPDFLEIEFKEQILRIQIPSGLDAKMNIPLNTFLRQEIEQFQRVLTIVRVNC